MTTRTLRSLRDKRQALAAVTALGVLLWMGVGTASAHRVIVFAWVEGNTVHVEGKFPGGRKVQHGRVRVYDPEGALLLEGETSRKGTFDFQAPGRSSLKIVLDAGAGHRGEWMIPAQEVGVGDQGSGGAPAVPRPSEAQKPPPAGQDSLLTRQDIQVAVEKALDKKLQPVIRRLVESRQSPSLTEILGGIGYIAGLVGVAAYVQYRRKSRRSGSQGG